MDSSSRAVTPEARGNPRPIRGVGLRDLGIQPLLTLSLLWFGGVRRLFPAWPNGPVPELIRCLSGPLNLGREDAE